MTSPKLVGAKEGAIAATNDCSRASGHRQEPQQAQKIVRRRRVVSLNCCEVVVMHDMTFMADAVGTCGCTIVPGRRRLSVSPTVGEADDQGEPHEQPVYWHVADYQDGAMGSGLDSVSKVEMTTPMALIYMVLFPSISTFETPPLM
jgi:hypothetical protein